MKDPIYLAPAIEELAKALGLLSRSYARELRSMESMEVRDKVLEKLARAEKLLRGNAE